MYEIRTSLDHLKRASEAHAWHAVQSATRDTSPDAPIDVRDIGHKLIIVAFWGQFDEAGHPSDRPAFLIAGGLAEVEKWATLDREWMEILNDEGTKDEKGIVWFHWKDFRHGKNAFTEWSRDRRESLFVKLVSVIQRNMRVVIAAYKLYDPGDERGRVRDEYLRAHGYVVRQSLADLYSHGLLTEPVNFIFARHPEINPVEHHVRLKADLSKASAHYENIGDIVISDPRDKPGLQAADLLASEIYAWHTFGRVGLPRSLESLNLPFILRGIQ